MGKTVKWMVILTGIYDLVLGCAQIAGAMTANPIDKATWLSGLMSGAFLLFCGAIIIWAAQDLTIRAPALLWQGLVRVFAAVAIFTGLSRDYIPAALVQPTTIAAFIDAAIAAFYLLLLFGILKLSPIRTLLGRSG